MEPTNQTPATGKIADGDTIMDCQEVEDENTTIAEQEDKALIFNLEPFHSKLEDMKKKHTIKSFSKRSEVCLSRAVAVHLLRILTAAVKLSRRRRTDVNLAKASAAPLELRISSNLKAEISQMREKARPEWRRKEEESLWRRREAKRLREAAEAEEERAAIVTRVPIGSDDWMEEWNRLYDAAPKQRREELVHKYMEYKAQKHQKKHKEGGGGESKETRGGGSKRRLRYTITVRDLIAFMERNGNYCKSLFLFRLYERDAIVKLSQRKIGPCKRVRAE